MDRKIVFKNFSSHLRLIECFLYYKEIYPEMFGKNIEYIFRDSVENYLENNKGHIENSILNLIAQNSEYYLDFNLAYEDKRYSLLEGWGIKMYSEDSEEKAEIDIKNNLLNCLEEILKHTAKEKSCDELRLMILKRINLQDV